MDPRLRGRAIPCTVRWLFPIQSMLSRVAWLHLSAVLLPPPDSALAAMKPLTAGMMKPPATRARYLSMEHALIGAPEQAEQQAHHEGKGPAGGGSPTGR